MNDPTLPTHAVGPYANAIIKATLAIEDLERSMRTDPLPSDYAQVAVGAAVRHLVETGQLPPLATRNAPAPTRRLPDNHRANHPSTHLRPVDDARLDAARRALGG